MAQSAAMAGYFPPLRPSPHPRRARADLTLLEAIISGGQTGVDQAGLRAARALGLQTGGYAPLGYRTLAGTDLSLGTEYGLVECGSVDYAHRTARNVHGSCATLRIASDFSSTGELCTLRAIHKYSRPSLDIHRDSIAPGSDRLPACCRALRSFLLERGVRVLNVAGNSEETSPGISKIAEAFLVLALGETFDS